MTIRCAIQTLLFTACLICPGVLSLSEAQVTVGRRGDVLLRNTHAEFMLFVSYFDGLDASSSWATDFDWLYGIGVRGLRVFPNWWRPDLTCDPDTVITLSGINPLRLQQLKNLITVAGQKGLLVEVALSRETVCGMPPFPADPTAQQKTAYLNGVKALAQQLASYGNIIVDLQNEWNHVFPSGDGLAQVLAIRDAYRQGDTSKIPVASMDQNADPATAVQLATVHGLGAVAYHDRRWGEWYDAELSSKITAFKEGLRNTRFPVYLNEPRYWEDGQVTKEQFRQALRTAKAQGAAIWTFHTEKSFDLATQSLWNRMTSTERSVLQTLRDYEGADWGVVDAHLAPAVAHFAEGSTKAVGSGNFRVEIALANPTGMPAEVQLVYMRDDGLIAGTATTISAAKRRTVTPGDLRLLQAGNFATTVKSSTAVFADRYMMWDTRRYGTHLERSAGGARQSWYFAEGVTAAGFQTYLLFSNLNGSSVDVTVNYLPIDGPLVIRTYEVLPNSRWTVLVNAEPGLSNTQFSMEVQSSLPILAERAVYRDVPGKQFGAGHGAAGVGLANEWSFAEGATGTFFDDFILIANPGWSQIIVEATYRLDSGTVFTKQYPIGPRSRFTVWVDEEDPLLLAGASVGVSLRGLSGATFAAERAMWWPGPTPATWYEAHAGAGTVERGYRWVSPSGEVAGPFPTATYSLIANEDNVARRVRVQLLPDETTPWVFSDAPPSLCQPSQPVTTYLIGPNTRFNVVARTLYGNVGQQQCRFGAVFTAVDDYGVPVTGARLVVEQAIYNDSANPGSVWWDGGAVALATRWP